MYSAFNSTAYISIVQLVQLVFDNWKVSIITSQKYLLGKWPKSLFRKPYTKQYKKTYISRKRLSWVKPHLQMKLMYKPQCKNILKLKTKY